MEQPASPVSVAVRGLSKSFGAFKALDDVSFDIALGEFTCLLGPSGCGKTTLLRCLAGLETPSAGRIVQEGTDVTALPPSQRDFGIVFQSYALFPNLSVFDNIAFGLVNAGQSRAPIRARVTELLALVGLQGQEAKFPAQLSGGQQQRVALARALAPSPGLLLLDEPLSALDAKVRARLRREIRELQSRLGVTTIMVTHDQEEAQTMADRIVVMNHGRVEQIGPPEEIYDRPASAFVADFIGVMNFIDARVSGPGQVRAGTAVLALDTGSLPDGHPVRLAIRPEHLGLASTSAAGGVTLEGTVRAVESLGSFKRLLAQVAALDAELTIDLPHDTPALARGQRVQLQADPARLWLFDAASGARLSSPGA